MQIPLVAALVALALLALSGVGVRAGLWTFPTGFLLLRVAFWLGLSASAVAVGLLIFAPRAVPSLIAALVIGGVVAFVPWNQRRAVKSLPFIHDVTTDLVDPPAFQAVLPLRAEAKNPAEYGGAATAAKQREGYPDIRPMVLTGSAGAAFHRVRTAAEGTGWEIVAVDSAAGRIEATATTFWFGFKDDVVLRVRPAGAGAVLDMRSLSRVGGSDVGANAARNRTFFAAVDGT